MVNFAQVGNDLYTGKRSIDFIGRQRTWYAVSGVLIALALVGIFVRGLNFGIEFRGGSEFRIPGVSSTVGYEEKARGALAQAGVPGNVVTTVIGGNTVRVQSEAANERNDAAKTALAQAYGVPANTVSASLIGPSWGQSVSTKAIQALIVFLVLVALVMAIYFRTWTMAVSGLVALVHDLIITVGIYSLFGFEITPSSMIGFLTILGYSLYDTVVVFDKVRENTTEAMSSRRSSYVQAANLAVNQTLVRSVNTTVVALLPIAAILVVGFTRLGPGTLLDLSLALFVGIAAGAYSSIFIATPLLVDLRSREPAVRELARHTERVQGRRPALVGAGKAGPRPGRDRADPSTVADPSTGPTSPPQDDPAASIPSEVPDAGAAPDAPGARSPGAGTPADGTPRPVHKWAQAGPRNQPRRPPRSRR